MAHLYVLPLLHVSNVKLCYIYLHRFPLLVIRSFSEIMSAYSYRGVSNRVQQSNAYCIVMFQVFHQTASYLGKGTFFNLVFLLLSHRPLPEQVMIKCSLNERINMSMELLNYTVGPLNYQIYQFLKAISSQTKTYGYSEEINKQTFLQSHIL